MLSFLDSAVFLLLVSSVFATKCLGKKKFLVYADKLNWHAALLNCSAQNMALATIKSKEEQKMLEDILKPLKTKGIDWTMYWIGGSDLHKEGEFIWFSTGENMKYTNFRQGQPDNWLKMSQEGENCMAIFYCFYWSDVVCNDTIPFICEYWQ